ncbi:MAG: glycosyltransferase family 2 protein [Gaiellaceae bacterium]
MISAVVVTYDSAGCIGHCLTSVREVLPGVELIVVDNGSRDETVAAARAVAPDAQVIEIGENVGFGRACNIGAEAAAGHHLLFLNPDSSLLSADITRIDVLLAARPFGLIAPALEGELERRRAESSWITGYFNHTFETLRPREWRPRVRSSGDATSAWVSGAMLLVSREEFMRLGGFDPRFFLYYEDRDLSRRYREAGLPIQTTDAIHGRHAVGRSSASDGLCSWPAAWSLLGWIQYVAIHDDERAAKRLARATLATLRVLRLGTHALAATRWDRSQRKARQLDELLAHVAERSAGDDVRFCPDALRAVRGLI